MMAWYGTTVQYRTTDGSIIVGVVYRPKKTHKTALLHPRDRFKTKTPDTVRKPAEGKAALDL